MEESPSSRLAGRAVVVTAGGTREPIDPVRYLGNRSSGRMGNAIAVAAADRGAAVTLVTAARPPDDPRLQLVEVETAADMDAAVRAALPGAALLVMAAAVADYRPAEVARRKLKKRDALTLELVPTVDILGGLAADPLRSGVMVVGFAAETDDLEANAARKLREKSLDLIVLNDVADPSIGMSSEHNAVTVIAAGGVIARVDRRPKSEVAAALLDIVEDRLPA